MEGLARKSIGGARLPNVRIGYIPTDENVRKKTLQITKLRLLGLTQDPPKGHIPRPKSVLTRITVFDGSPLVDYHFRQYRIR